MAFDPGLTAQLLNLAIDPDALSNQVSQYIPVLHVGADRRLYGLDGNRLYLRAITSFANTFALFGDGYRFDWGIRNSQNAKSIPTVSPPINRGAGFGKWLSYTYVDDDTCRSYIKNLKQYGFNTIRPWVGSGMVKTAAFTDPITGLSFPPELALLDNMVRFTAEAGMYLWLTFGAKQRMEPPNSGPLALIAMRHILSNARRFAFGLANTNRKLLERHLPKTD